MLNDLLKFLESDESEQARLNELVRGKTIARIEFKGDDMQLHFTDGFEVWINHIGGLELIERK